MKQRVDARCDIVVNCRCAYAVAGLMVGVDQLMCLCGGVVIAGGDVSRLMKSSSTEKRAPIFRERRKMT